MNLFTKVLDFLYPPRDVCLNCNKTIKVTEIKGLCTECLKKIHFIKNFCLKCGRSLSKPQLKICSFCQNQKMYYDKARAVAFYSDVLRDLIIKFKYQQNLFLQGILTEILSQAYYYYYAQFKIDYLFSIPLHRLRERERGFNQVELLASTLSKKINKKLDTNSLIRVKNTQALYDLNLKERINMLKSCFLLKENSKYRDKNILLLDDIFTTGSTVNEASFVLKKQGKVNKIYVLTLGTGKV